MEGGQCCMATWPSRRSSLFKPMLTSSSPSHNRLAPSTDGCSSGRNADERLAEQPYRPKDATELGVANH